MNESDLRINWAGNLTYSAARIHRPRSIDALRAVVRSSRKVRALGSRHSFNAIADCDEDLVAVDGLPRVLDIDRERCCVTVSGGARYGDVCPHIHAAGLALHNLASLPHISIAGAIATATHGSGDGNGNLAAAVSGMQVMTADGEIVTLSRERDGARFAGAVVGLGALGIVTQVTLDAQPAFAVQQEIYERLPTAELEANFDAITSSAYSVSLFTDWQHAWVNAVWLKRRLDDGVARPLASSFFGAAPAANQRHPIDELSGEPCTPQLGRPGPWHERLPHFRIDQTPSAGEELQSEFFVPRRHALAAMRAVAALREVIGQHLMISEVRTIAADALWLSPCYEQDSVGLHFTWKRDWPAVRALLPRIEAALAPFEPRPHWGKLFTLPAAVIRARYPRLDDFRALAREFDPGGKFRNAYLDEYVFG